MSSTIYRPVRTRPPALRGSTVPAARVAKVLSGAEGASQSGIWVGIFAITMSFAAFTSALFVRQGSAADWTHIALPPVLYANTLALLLSSATLQMARRAVTADPSIQPRTGRVGLGWLMATLALGFVFVAGQFEAWRQLAAQGLYLATNPNSSFYYVLTAMHGLHVLAGIVALALVMGRIVASRAAFRKSTFEATATYWHFMGVLWLYLLLVLRTKL
ncbi:MAG TPA: cytochrome c oxidase subunit 3 [Candidatus Dormibacteraeota bacterium]|nr:cytochrome c oxidase subunit 3 [Candidatus Dormibacteraeota bacterium]